MAKSTKLSLLLVPPEPAPTMDILNMTTKRKLIFQSRVISNSVSGKSQPRLLLPQSSRLLPLQPQPLLLLLPQLNQLTTMMKNPDTPGKFTAPPLKEELNMLIAKTQSQLLSKTSSSLKLLTSKPLV